MPLTKKGKKVLRSLRGTYGSGKKAKSVLYAMKNKGTVTGVDKQHKDSDETEYTGTDPSSTGTGAPGRYLKRKRPHPGNASEPAGSSDPARLGAGDAWSEEAREAAAEARRRGATKQARIEQAVQAGLHSYRTEQERNKRKDTPENRAKFRERVAGINKQMKGMMSKAYGGKGRGLGGGSKHFAVAYGPIDGINYTVPDVAMVVADERRDFVMHDTIEFDDASRVQYTDEGYLKAVPRICRTGIQLYGGDECGRADLSCVRVFRPEDQVFKTATMHGYARLPITLDHPGVMVSSDNWKDYAVGETGDEVTRDGTTVRVPFMLRDAKAVAAFKQGTNQLSVGYVCDLKWQDGKTPDGEVYDAIQTNIRPNHLAVVAAARGGSTLRIGDQDEGESDRMVCGSRWPSGSQSPSINTIGDNDMTVKMTVDGLQCSVADEQSASIIQRTIDNLRHQLADVTDAFKKKEEECEESEDAARKLETDAKKLVEAKDGEIAALKKQAEDAKVTASQLDGMVKDRLAVIDKARVVFPRIQTDGRELNDIRKQVVANQIPAAKDWSDEKIQGAFDVMTAQQTRGTNQTNMGDVVSSFQQPSMAVRDARQEAYDAYDKHDAEAWRNPGKAA